MSAVAAAAPKLSEQALQRFVAGLTALSGVPAIGVLVRFDGNVVRAASGTPSDALAAEGPRVPIGCIGKALVAAVALLLAEANELDLEASIEHYLPELSRTPKAARILVRHLMCNTAGYAGITTLGPRSAALTWEGLVEEFVATPQLFEPGTVYDHDHSAFALLSAIIERAAKLRATELIERLILDPLGPEPAADRLGAVATERRPSRETASPPGPLSPIWSAAVSARRLSLDQLARVAELLTAGRAAGCDLVLPDSVRRLLGTRAIRIPAAVGGRLSPCLPTGAGLGLAEHAHDVLGRDGTGPRSVAGFRASRDGAFAFAVGVAACAPLVRNKLVEAILAELGRPCPGRGRSAPLGIDPNELPGRYAGSGGLDIRVSAAGNELAFTVAVGASGRTLELSGRLDEDGCLEVGGAALTAGLTFFRDPTGGAPCMMLGLNAAKKISDEQ